MARNTRRASGGELDLSFQPFEALEPVTANIIDVLGAAPGFILALLLLLASLILFDRVLKQVDTGWLRRRVFRRFRNRWIGTVLGVIVTGLTTSVAFSLGVIVPLYNPGYLERREVIPYVLGANLGTLFDKLAVAVVLKSPDGVTLVLSLLAAGTVVTIGALLGFTAYLDLIEAIQTRLVEDRRQLMALLASLVVVPLALTLL